MGKGPVVDGVLLQWGERLFYPANRIVRGASAPRWGALGRLSAPALRARIVATVQRRAPQVMVKVTGGGRGMAAIAAHLRYISKNGRLDIEDDRGEVRRGREAMHDVVDQWRHGGALIPEQAHRREAFNIMLSMPRGTDPLVVQRAAREFAAVELKNHRYVMVLHDHQANPHVHISVRAAGRDGSRLNPRKADLHRWRETFADKLRGWGIEAEASRQATRGEVRRFDALWQVKAKADGRLDRQGPAIKSGAGISNSRMAALTAWGHIVQALGQSERPEDRALAQDVVRYLRDSAFVRAQRRSPAREFAGVSPAKNPKVPDRVSPVQALDLGR